MFERRVRKMKVGLLKKMVDGLQVSVNPYPSIHSEGRRPITCRADFPR